MLQSCQAAGMRPATPSQMPYSCGTSCLFFEKGVCRKAEIRGPVTKFARARPLYTEGSASSHCYKVLEGAVRLSRILNDGHRQILDIALPGDTFGIELSETYAATAEAVGEVVALKCSRACIDRRSEFEHKREMLGMLSRSLVAAQDHVAMLGHQGAKERVASFLAKLADSQDATGTIDLPVGRQDMADYLGLTIETTCRAMSDLKSSGIISAPSRQQIVIKNRARLDAIIDGSA